MTVGISFDDKATKQISNLNKLMDDTGKGFSKMNTTATSSEKGFSSFGKTGEKSIKKVDTAMTGLRDEFSSANFDLNNFGRTGVTEMKKVEKGIDRVGTEAQTSGKEISQVGLAGEKAGIGVKKGMKEAEKGVDDVGKKSSKLSTSFSQLGQKGISSIQNLGSKFSGLGGLATNSFSRIGSSITNFVTAPLRGAIGLAKQYAGVLGLLSGGSLAASGMARLSAIENAKTSLTVMMGDAGKASKFMDEVLAFAKTTPFAFPDLAETSRNLIAFGMDEAKVVPTMKAIGDAAAATGKGSEGLNQVASAFGDMQIAGTLGLDQINRLQSAGVPALKILANQFGMSTDHLKKLISKGMIDSVESIDLLVDGMQKGTKGVAGQTAAMAGIMEKTKENWTGSVDSMKSSISSGMAKIMEPAKPHIQNAMAWFGTQFGKLPDVVFGIVDKVKPFAQGFANVFSTTFQAITAVIEVFKGDIGSFNAMLIFRKIGLTQEQANRAVSLVESVRDGITGAIETVIGIGSSIKNELGNNMTGILDSALSFAEGIRDNWGPIRETVITLGIAVITFKGIMMGLTVISTINTLMTAYRAGTLLATLAQYGLNTAMLANPMTWVVVGIAALVAGGVALYRNFDAIKLKATELWQKLMENPMYALAIGPIGALIAAGISLYQNWDTIKTSASSLWTTISGVWTLIQSATSLAWSSVKESISNSMATAATSVANFFSPLLSFIATAKTAWDGFKSAVSNFKMPDFKMPSIGMPKFLGGNGLIQMGSHATGLGRVPYDEYPMYAHKDEAILTANQSNALRSAGMLKGDGAGPTLDMSNGSSGEGGAVKSASSMPQMIFNITGENPQEIGRQVRMEIEKFFSRLNAVSE